MRFNIPIFSETAARLITLLREAGLGAGDPVLDVGCGAGELLIELARATGCEGRDVDLSAACIAQAQASAPAGLRFEVGDARSLDIAPGSLAGLLCLGASHAFASGEPAASATLAAATRWLRPGGLLLLGEGFWQRPPAPEYLAVLGEEPGVYRDHRGNVAMLEAAGLTPLFAGAAREDEWDAFEWGHAARARREGDEAAIARTRRWIDAYLRWGRGTMGFGFYIAQA